MIKTDIEVYDIARQLAERPCFDVELGPLIGEADEYFRAILAPVIVTPELASIVQDGRRAVGYQKTPVVHVSFLYGLLSQENIDEFTGSHKVPEALRRLKITQVGVMEANGLPTTWRVLHTFPMG